MGTSKLVISTLIATIYRIVNLSITDDLISVTLEAYLNVCPKSHEPKSFVKYYRYLCQYLKKRVRAIAGASRGAYI